ncbi:hypothetical protein LTR78_003419 [Recurvomyces mirabilis]|uniref:Tyrosine specific protein phosphatases domain-containing protein n=1 Tax=Recurvomyces mirabilis TaxID=574656 RepID=A0AAE0WS61_9PEZI|nr:hypothetical protein LTR78_003419 [Recurvomyces mirabilis]KAK5154547.1 hypothetical protein LTS14_006684 [Recurvomyces mirabilis]
MDRSQLLRLRERMQHLVKSVWLKDWRSSTLFTTILSLALLGSLRRVLSLTIKRGASEPGLFKKNSTFSPFTTVSGHHYPRIRLFYSPHAQAAKLPKDLPLLVFIHGLGGNATQFAPLLTSLVNVAPCLAIDLPGCGQSDFKPDDAAAYTTSAFAELVCAAIEKFRDAESNQQVILIGHSMGCSIAALLASSTSPLRERLKCEYVIGLIALNPRAGPFIAKEARAVSRLKHLPVAAFDLIRMWDRLGGVDSSSITRMVGEGADAETRKLQQSFNEQSRSPVVLRFVAGMLPGAAGSEVGLPGEKVWSGIKVPLFLVAGEADKVTSPKEVEKIAGWLTRDVEKKNGRSDDAETHADRQRYNDEEEVAPDAEPLNSTETAAPIPTTAGDLQVAQHHLSSSLHTPSDSPMDPPKIDGVPIKDKQQHTHHAFALKTTIFPTPAAHAIMYTTSTLRPLCGFLQTFLSSHIDERLSLGWQLQHLATSGKWDVKNLSKWSSIAPCSAPIGKPIPVFRAMKTMREVDEVHNPREFVKKFGAGVLADGVAMVVDISHESPVYDPKGLEEGGVEYHKFPPVSKLPPTADEVEHFIALINHLREAPKLQPRHHPQPGVIREQPGEEDVRPVVGIHCHYGFNRTGFLIICYLIERLGYRLLDALAEFAEKRAPGIKHEHFVNELFVRYADEVGRMERRGTVVG